MSEVTVPNIPTTQSQGFDDGPEARIKLLFEKTEVSVSAYDTAWVAMLASPASPKMPCFPECTRWILENQLDDGSWGLPHRHPLLVKDYLLCTLACILALKKWGIGEQQINKGLQFIESNSSCVTDEKQLKPIGFDIIFPGMIEIAKDLQLNIPFNPKDIDSMLYKKDLELKSNMESRKAYLAFVSEGIGKLQDWNMVMKYQRKNGSLFNSPSTTAAAFLHTQNADCLLYIRSLVEKFGNAVPAVYPLDVYARLCMVDILKRLGIERHFKKEIELVLDDLCRFWLHEEEEIFLDTTTCAMAFRTLRLHGYDVSPDLLKEFSGEHFDNSFGGYMDMMTTLELYRASQIVFPDESRLEKQNTWTRDFLKKNLSRSLDKNELGNFINVEVLDALDNDYYADLEVSSYRRNIERYGANNLRLLKTSYRCSNLGNNDFLKLAVEDFNACQSIRHEELADLRRWVMENRLDKLKYCWQQHLNHCYLTCAGTLAAPELSNARLPWAKFTTLIAIVDDFFDVDGSEVEIINLVQLIEKWDIGGSAGFCSERVEIFFYAFCSTICETGEKALAMQGRNVTDHIREISLDFLRSVLIEGQWMRNKIVPTINEYMSISQVSMGIGLSVIPALYFVGPKLSEEVVRGSEIHALFEASSIIGRLLNDVRGFKRESSQGKLNAVSLTMINGYGNETEEQAIQTIQRIIDSHRKQLCRLIFQENGSTVPRPCKDLFWKMLKELNFFYNKHDGFRSSDTMSILNSVINEPILLDV